jgi:hypothetical protein
MPSPGAPVASRRMGEATGERPRRQAAPATDALRQVPGQGRDRAAAPLGRVLPRLLPALLPPAGRQGDREAPHAGPERARAGRGLRRQGLARALGHPAPARLPGRRALPRARHRRLLRPLGRDLPRVRRRARRHAHLPRRRQRAGLHHPAGDRDRRQVVVRGVRAVQALHLQQGRARRRLRRHRYRAQPRRRGCRAVRQHAPLGPGVDGAAGSGPPGRALPARSSRCTASPSGRPPPTASSPASTTS